MKCSCVLMSVCFNCLCNWTHQQLELQPSIICFKFLSRKLTSVSGEESARTGADTVDANSELQCYMA